MKGSIIAGLIAAALGLFSMGLLGGLLYYAVYPLFAPFHGDINDWRGDDVWPAAIGAGMLWSLSFPAAGFINRRLEQAGIGRTMRVLLYGLTLWLGAAAVWAFMTATLDIRFAPV